MARELAIFANKKLARPEGVEVSIKVRAVDTGYLKGLIIPPGEEFVFTGKIYKGKLSHWMEEVEEGSLAKAIAAAKSKSSGVSAASKEESAPKNAGDLV